jgi:fibronectin-binding autotransporter adhesin
MRKRSRIQSLSLCVGGLAFTGFAGQALAQTVTGNLSTTGVNYGSNVPGTGALATQTINTGFGDSTVGDGTSGGGSELDASYGTIQNGNLYIFLAGNVEDNGNVINIFIDDGAANGQSTLNITSNGYAASAMNGSQFSPKFAANLQLDVNDYAGTMYVNQYVLGASGSTNSYLGSVNLSSGVGSGTLGGIAFGLNNTNAAGVNGDTGTAADTAAAQAVSTGLEIGIPLADLGNPSGNILVLADINGGNDGYLSNQFLPGLPVGTGNLGTSTFNFSTTAGEYFTVSAPAVVPNGNWIQPNAGSWNNSTNWSNGYVPTLAGDSANFSGATVTSTVTLDGAHSVGTLSFSDSSASYVIAAGSGGTLTLDNGSNTAAVTDYAGAHTISAPVVLNSNTTFSVVNPGDSITVSGNITGTGGLTVDNPGDSVVTVSGTNTYGGGTTVLAGNLRLGSSSSLPTGTALTLSALDLPAGTLDLNGNNATVSSITVLTGPHTVLTGSTAQIINTNTNPAITATLTYAGVNSNPSTFSGNISDNANSAGSTTSLVVSSGSLTLTGTNSYAGNTTVNTGASLTFSSATFAGTTFPAGENIANNGSLALNDSVTVGSITGSGSTSVGAGQAVSVNTINQGGTLDNEGSLTVFAGGAVGRLTETGTAGSLALYGGTLQLAANAAPSSQSVLYIASGAALDITNNIMFIDYGTGPDPIASIAQWIANGFSDLPGPQIISSSIASADAASGLSYGIGYADGADGLVAGLPSGEIEIMFTLLGDANLDGTVNAEDYTPFSHNLGQSGMYWDDGDFNYDGTVNAEDYTLFAHNIGQSAQYASTGGPLEPANSSLSLTNVPEPASAGLAIIAGFGILRRRRRSS